MTERWWAKRFLFLAAAAFAAFTLAWVVVAFVNNGDAFPQGLAVPMLPLLGLSPVAVAWSLRRNDSKLGRVLVAAATLLAVAFWLLVPNGWWAVGPP
jgi:FtsH-binding integral membrane protein